MSIRVWPLAPSQEAQTSELLKKRLLDTEPQLAHPDIDVEIISDIHLPERQIDQLILYQDRRNEADWLRTLDGRPIHSFVLLLEVKKLLAHDVRFQGTSLSVKYGSQWKNATYQCDQQTYAFKNFQASRFGRNESRNPVFTQRAIWLPNVDKNSFTSVPEKSSVPIHFQDMQWNTLVSQLEQKWRETGEFVRAFFRSNAYHTLETLKTRLTHVIVPTELDLKKVDRLTRERFDAEKTQYIQNIGSGLLMLRGRGGTGKTASLMQIAHYLAKRNQRCLILTYNHGLIADITRSLQIIGRQNPHIEHLPDIQTRYTFIQDMFVDAFGTDQEKRMIQDVPLDFREDARLEALLKRSDVRTDYDYVLIDEGQDWSDQQRDLIYNIFGAERVIVADGIDQFVGSDRCTWDTKGVGINRRHRLRQSLRTKGATCQLVAKVARSFNVSDWDLEPDPKVYGGRMTVIVDPIPKSAMKKTFEIITQDISGTDSLKPSDNLVCMPSSKMANGMNYPHLFDLAIEERGWNSWRGFDESDRRQMVEQQSQLRAVLYNSCRGMEGWTVVCLGLDAFFDFQCRNPRIDKERIESSLREREGIFADGKLQSELNTKAAEYAVNWLMIPLTRSIDHLVIHLSDERSLLAQKLKAIRDEDPDSIRWINDKINIAMSPLR